MIEIHVESNRTNRRKEGLNNERDKLENLAERRIVIPNLRPIKQIDLQGKLMREFKSAQEASVKLKLSISTIRNMIRGLQCETKSYRFVYADGLPVYSHTGTSRTEDVFREIEKYHQRRNGKPAERICMRCGRKFISTQKGNRRCHTCNCEVNNEYHALEYRHF